MTNRIKNKIRDLADLCENATTTHTYTHSPTTRTYRNTPSSTPISNSKALYYICIVAGAFYILTAFQTDLQNKKPKQKYHRGTVTKSTPQPKKPIITVKYTPPPKTPTITTPDQNQTYQQILQLTKQGKYQQAKELTQKLKQQIK
jgi:hypothetical protein